MGNRNKKIWSMLLSLVLVVTTIFGTSMIPQATKTYAATDKSDLIDGVADKLDGTVKIHFRKPSAWKNTPSIYAFVKDSNYETIGHLTGKEWAKRQPMSPEVTVGDDQWYSYDVPKYTGTEGTVYVVFTDGGNAGAAQYPADKCPAEQRLSPKGETWYELHTDGTIKTYTTNPINGATPVVTPTGTPANTTTPDGDTIRIHFRRPTDWKETPKIYAYLKPQKSTKENEENKTNPTSVHFSGNTWDDRMEMTLEGTNEKGTWYYFDIPKHDTGYSYAIFTNGGKKGEENVARYPKDKDYDNYLIVTGETWYYLSSTNEMTVYQENQTADINKPTATPTATVEPSATPAATVEPSATPTATVEPSATPTATVEPSATPIATVEPSTTPTATATTEASVTPTATNVPDVPQQSPVVSEPTKAPTESTPEVTASEAVPTAEVPQATTPVQTIEPTQPAATSTPNVTVTVPTGSAASDNTAITPSAVTAKVTFSKLGKTVGETVLVKVALSQKKSAAAYTFTYYIDGRAVKADTRGATYEWTLTSKGTHKVTVVVKENKKMVTYQEVTYKVKPRVITIQKFKANKKSGQKAKTKITLSATAKTTTGKLSYRFAVQKGKGKVTYLGKYSKKKKVVWKPASKGTYTLYVYAKNGKGVEVKKAIKNFKIK